MDDLRRNGTPPPGFPKAGVVIAEMHAACPQPYLSFCDYYLADYARHHGGTEDLELAARNLEASAAATPGTQENALRMAVFLADIYRGLGRFGAARRVLDKGQASARGRVTDPALLSNLFGLRGELARENGRLDEAHADTEQAMALSERSKDAIAIERAVHRGLELALATGRFQEVRNRVDSILAELGDRDPALRSDLLICRGYAESGLSRRDPTFLPAARTTLKKALEGMNSSAVTKALLKLADLALRAGDIQDAQAMLGRARVALGFGPDLAGISWTPDACDLVDLENRCCLARGAGLAELRAQRNRHAQALSGLCEQWSSQPPSRSGIGFLHMDSRRDLLGSGIDLALALASAAGEGDGAARGLDDLLLMQAMVSLARARGAKACTERDVRGTFLQHDQVAIVYLPTHAKTHVFLIERDGVRHVALAAEQEIYEPCQALVREILRAPALVGKPLEAASERFAAASAAAAQHLIPESFKEAILGASGVTVVGADLLYGVPFEALLCEGGKLLGEIVPLDNLSSLPHGVHLSALPGLSRTPSLMAMVCTAPTAAVAAAAGVEPFVFPAKTLAATFAEYRDPVVLVDAEATLERVRGLKFASVDILHCIAHGAEDLAGTGARDLVAFDGRITKADLENHASPRLVLVSVCGAGVGPSRPGEGDLLTSFAGTFLWEGALAAIASPNDIAALDHLAFMRVVHRLLAAGNSPARAMQAARAELSEGGAGALYLRAQRALVQVTGLGQRRL